MQILAYVHKIFLDRVICKFQRKCVESDYLSVFQETETMKSMFNMLYLLLLNTDNWSPEGSWTESLIKKNYTSKHGRDCPEETWPWHWSTWHHQKWLSERSEQVQPNRAGQNEKQECEQYTSGIGSWFFSQTKGFLLI